MAETFEKIRNTLRGFICGGKTQMNAATRCPRVRSVHLLFYLRSCSQRGAQRVLHGLRQDGGALAGHHRHQAAVLREKHGQVGAAASATDAITCTHSAEMFND